MENISRLDSFKRISKSMIAINDRTYDLTYGRRNRLDKFRNYTKEEVLKIIQSGDLFEQIKLSENYFSKDGFYKRLIIYYATILMYKGVLIPNPMPGKQLSEKSVKKRYESAIDFVEQIEIETLFTEISKKVLVDGAYYGLILNVDKESLTILDLPAKYCRSRFKDFAGNDLIEFNVAYFTTIRDLDSREDALSLYPKVVVRAFRNYLNGDFESQWVFIPSEIGISFNLFESYPFFLNVIPAVIDYEAAVETERERELEEIRKILVQKIPHLNDGGLLFEPDEAEVMHEGAVGMMKNNKNISVLTTYADVEIESSKTTSDNVTNNLEKMVNNIYYEGGASKELFAASGSTSLGISIKNDTAMMMFLANKYSRFITRLVNQVFQNGNVKFKYQILPISYYNSQDFIDESFKLAQSGYSFLLPSVAMGISQRDLSNLKDLENDVLGLMKKLEPLNNSYNQSNSTNKVGRPALKDEDKSEKTIKNQEAIENNS